MRTELRFCACCGDERLFEAPPCLDDHGVDCPELACAECGAALLVDPPTALPHRFVPVVSSAA